MELAPGFLFKGAADHGARALECLATAALYEAGDDPDGQRAVVQVVLNRARHPSFPPTICGVVFQGSERATGCQFTFTCDGSLARRHSSRAWGRARAVALAALAGGVDERVGSATHYHADYVIPWWSSSLEKVAQVGLHIFYRWPGARGRRSILRESIAQDELAVRRNLPLRSPQQPAEPRPGIGAVADGDGRETVQPAALPRSTIILAADMSSAPGRWAVDALSRCHALSACVVLVYGTQQQAERASASPADAREAPLFLFVRDNPAARDVALWDCAVVSRADPAQCMPTETAALRRLVRDRES